jgi:hypothetical protein
LYKVDPRLCSFACNLFSKDRWRLALLDKVMEGRPQVPLVSKPSAFACAAERLAWTASRPYWPVVGPSCTAEGKAPYSNSGEKVTLGVSRKLIWCHIFNTSFVNNSGRNVPSIN